MPTITLYVPYEHGQPVSYCLHPPHSEHHVETYALPDGYQTGQDATGSDGVFDADGNPCAIAYDDRTGSVRIFNGDSLRGKALCRMPDEA